MKRRHRAAILTAACSLALAAIGAALPIWTISHHHTIQQGNREYTLVGYRTVSVWTAPAELSGRGPFFRQRNAIQGVILGSLVTVVGLLVYRRLDPKPRPEAIDDYAEKADSSIADGRT